MIDAKNAKYQDRAIRSIVEDRLDRAPFADSLISALLRDEYDKNGKLISRTATGNVVGLVGKWGLGKSSILNLIKLKLEKMPRVAVVLFNPWLFNGRDELVRAFFNSMREALGTTPSDTKRDLVKALNKYWQAIDWLANAGSKYADLHFGGRGISSVWQFISLLSKGLLTCVPPSPIAAKELLEGQLTKHKLSLVVLIDELDRVEDSEVRAVAQLVKALGEIKGISYLVAYDQERVVDALGRGNDADERARTGQAYLEKIIQHPIPLRPLFANDVEMLLKSAMDDHGLNPLANINESELNIFDQIKSEITTPREIKRLIGSFSILEDAVRGEINTIDILSYCWILTKSPLLRDEIQAHLDKVVEDPIAGERLARMEGADPFGTISARAIFKNANDSNEKILSLVFPRFGARRSTDDGTRLSLRRNLVRLLYLGNPPGMVRRDEIEKLWSVRDPAVVQYQLKILSDQSKLRALIDRLSDLLPDLDAEGDATFWPALANLLVRPQDWASGFDERNELGDDAAAMLLGLGRRGPSHSARLKNIVESLIVSGDFTIAPTVIRRELYGHGLTRHKQGISKNHSLSSEVALILFERECERYKNSIFDGTIIRRCVNIEAVYTLLNMNYWNDVLRASLTAQMTDIKSIGTVASLIVPPGYNADREVLNELFDADKIKKRLDEILEKSGLPSDPWLKTSVRNLKKIVDGFGGFWEAEQG